MFKINSFLFSFIHVIFAFWVPAFYLYSLNIGESFFFEFLFTIFFLALLAFVFLFIFKKKVGTYVKSSILISSIYFGCYVAITLYRQIYTLESAMSFFRFLKPLYFFVIYFFILFLFLLIVYKKKKYTISSLNFFSFIFLYLIIFYSFQSYLSYRKIDALNKAYCIQNNIFRENTEKTFDFFKSRSNYLEKRDIYYIILDAHASFSDLKEYHNYDPTWFMNELRSRGFFLPKNSKSNYDHTVLSLPSSLNMNYNSTVLCSQTVLLGFACYAIENNNWAYFMKKLGYRFINIPSSWGATRRMHRQFSLRDIFFGDFIQNFIYTFTSRLFLSSLYNYIKRKETLDQLSLLKKRSREKGPKAVFAHFICPHIPLVFKKNGDLILRYRNDNQAYIDQLDFFDKQIIKVIDYIFKKSEKTPIIILQSDHGSHGYVLYPPIRDNFTKSDIKKLKFNNLSAFLLPDVERYKLSDDISPVNNFRFIFNEYFGTNFEILENKQIG